MPDVEEMKLLLNVIWTVAAWDAVEAPAAASAIAQVRSNASWFFLIGFILVRSIVLVDSRPRTSRAERGVTGRQHGGAGRGGRRGGASRGRWGGCWRGRAAEDAPEVALPVLSIPPDALW